METFKAWAKSSKENWVVAATWTFIGFVVGLIAGAIG